MAGQTELVITQTQMPWKKTDLKRNRQNVAKNMQNLWARIHIISFVDQREKSPSTPPKLQQKHTQPLKHMGATIKVTLICHKIIESKLLEYNKNSCSNNNNNSKHISPNSQGNNMQALPAILKLKSRHHQPTSQPTPNQHPTNQPYSHARATLNNKLQHVFETNAHN